MIKNENKVVIEKTRKFMTTIKIYTEIVLSFICILKIGQLNPGSVSTTIVESKFSTAESNFSSFLHRLA